MCRLLLLFTHVSTISKYFKILKGQDELYIRTLKIKLNFVSISRYHRRCSNKVYLMVHGGNYALNRNLFWGFPPDWFKTLNENMALQIFFIMEYNVSPNGNGVVSLVWEAHERPMIDLAQPSLNLTNTDPSIPLSLTCIGNPFTSCHTKWTIGNVL